MENSKNILNIMNESLSELNDENTINEGQYIDGCRILKEAYEREISKTVDQIIKFDEDKQIGIYGNCFCYNGCDCEGLFEHIIIDITGVRVQSLFGGVDNYVETFLVDDESFELTSGQLYFYIKNKFVSCLRNDYEIKTELEVAHLHTKDVWSSMKRSHKMFCCSNDDDEDDYCPDFNYMRNMVIENMTTSIMRMIDLSLRINQKIRIHSNRDYTH